MNKGLERLFDWLQNRKLLLLVPFLILLVALLAQIPKIQSDYTVKYWFERDKVLIGELKEFEKNFGNQENIVLIYKHPKTVFGIDQLKFIADITDALLDVENISSTRSISNYSIVQGSNDEISVRPIYDPQDLTDPEFDPNDLIEFIQTDKQLKNYLLNDDGKVTIIYGFLKPTFEQKETIDHIKLISDVREKIEQFNKAGGEVLLTGSSKFQEEFRNVSEKDLMVITPFMILMVVIFLLISFRTLESIYIPIGVILLCIGSAFGIGSLVGVRFENIVSAVPGILFSICIADSVHLLVTYYNKRKEGLEAYESMKASFLKNFAPTLLTSLTTSVGFFSLLASDLTPIRNLGILAGVGSLLAWFYTILIMPILFLVLKRFETFKADSSKEEKKFQLKNYALPLLEKTYKFKWSLTGLFLLLLFAAVYSSFQNEVNSSPREYLSPEVEVRKNTDFLKTQFGGISGPELVIDSGSIDGIKDPNFLKKVDGLNDWLLSLPFVSKTLSTLDNIKEQNKVLNGGDQSFYKIPENRNSVAEIFLLNSMEANSSTTLSDQYTSDFQKLRLSVYWSLTDSKSNVKWFKQIEEEAKKRELNLSITGNAALGNRMNGFIVSTFVESMGLATILIFIILSILFKSIKLGFFSLIPNIVPILFGTALMSLFGHSIEAGAVMVCAVCLGISVDDTIHLMVNYLRNKNAGLDTYESLKNVLEHTGVALVVTTLILMVGFGVFIFADFIPNIRFGMYSSLVLFLALVIDIIFLPALLLLNYDKVKA